MFEVKLLNNRMLGGALLAVFTLSGCQTTEEFKTVSEDSSCLEIAESYNANEAAARDQCPDGWRIAGPYSVDEHPFVGVVEGKTLASAKQVLRQELRYCSDQLLDNFYETFNAWNKRLCETQSASVYRPYTYEQAKERRKRGVDPVSRPALSYLLRKKRVVINDPFLGCQGDGCPD
ncbi:hypothetical protein [Thalassospira sp. CH_XMU1420-2]|uniref:hypothetical protein n=1 Tax=Thalassospira sp. CH_XMU1420-2 TaxID=3107769 RepID=UPI00300A768F|tara:strand:- start:6099 stop:6626 length:528 start_codon:yes stop_codon:yes gene_type:complete